MPDDQLPHRVQRLEEGVDRLTETVGQQGQRFDSKLDAIGTSISLLVRIDERQVAIAERLQMGAATMQKHEERIAGIEAAMPGLKETRGWVIGGILTGVSMIGIAVLKLVVFA